MSRAGKSMRKGSPYGNQESRLDAQIRYAETGKRKPPRPTKPKEKK